MEAPAAPQARSRPSLPQLLRRLFELPWRFRGTQQPRAERQDLGAEEICSSPGGLGAQQTPGREGAEGESMEPLLGELEELSLDSSLDSSTSRSCLRLGTSSSELGVPGGVGDTPAGSPARQPADSGAASEKGTALPEAFGDKAPEMDGLLQGLGADGEDVSCCASPELIFCVDLEAESEKDKFLKADEGAGPPKAELPQWNRLFSMNRHRWTSHKPPSPGSLMELGSEEEPLLNEVAHRPATPALSPLPVKLSDVVLVERFSEDEAGETTGRFGRSWVELGASGEGTPGNG